MPPADLAVTAYGPRAVPGSRASLSSSGPRSTENQPVHHGRYTDEYRHTRKLAHHESLENAQIVASTDHTVPHANRVGAPRLGSGLGLAGDERPSCRSGQTDARATPPRGRRPPPAPRAPRLRPWPCQWLPASHSEGETRRLRPTRRHRLSKPWISRRRRVVRLSDIAGELFKFLEPVQTM